jgi:hypothetical protein
MTTHLQQGQLYFSKVSIGELQISVFQRELIAHADTLSKGKINFEELTVPQLITNTALLNTVRPHFVRI